MRRNKSSRGKNSTIKFLFWQRNCKISTLSAAGHGAMLKIDHHEVEQLSLINRFLLTIEILLCNLKDAAKFMVQIVSLTKLLERDISIK